MTRIGEPEQIGRTVAAVCMVGIRGHIRREGEVVRVIARQLFDRSAEHASVEPRGSAFVLPRRRGDEFPLWFVNARSARLLNQGLGGAGSTQGDQAAIFTRPMTCVAKRIVKRAFGIVPSALAKVAAVHAQHLEG